MDLWKILYTVVVVAIEAIHVKVTIIENDQQLHIILREKFPIKCLYVMKRYKKWNVTLNSPYSF